MKVCSARRSARRSPPKFVRDQQNNIMLVIFVARCVTVPRRASKNASRKIGKMRYCALPTCGELKSSIKSFLLVQITLLTWRLYFYQYRNLRLVCSKTNKFEAADFMF